MTNVNPAPTPAPPPPQTAPLANGPPTEKRRDIYDWATLATAIGGVLVVVVATTLTQCSQVASDQNVDKLVKSIDDLAKFAGRQADDTQRLRTATENFAAGMKRQADYTAQLVGATSTAADAAKHNAAAQDRMAMIASASTLPLLEMRELQLSGFKADKPETNGKYRIKLTFNYWNVGTGRLQGKAMSMRIDTVSELPTVPDFAAPASLIRAVPANEGFRPALPWYFLLSKAQLDDLSAHKTFPFIIGYIDYSDTLGQPHRQCFAFQLQLEDGDATTDFYETGPAPYHCRT